MPATSTAYSVTAITRRIKECLEQSFRDIWVEGEIADYKHHSSGHQYFNVRDENACLSVTLWKSRAPQIKFDIRNGQKVLVNGDIAVYEKGGNYQLNCKKILPVGIGPLELAFKQLYEKLSKEGLFDERRKRPLPMFPCTIGVVTSATGAAVRDVINVASRRNNSITLILYSAKVQGAGSADSVISGIQYFNDRKDVDLIILARGGGDLEDLWSFNSEILVRAIVASRLPVVTGIGHEVDFTLADYAADRRCPTPSAAAEIAVWQKDEFIQSLSEYRSALATSMRRVIEACRDDLQGLLVRAVWSRAAEQFVAQRTQYLDDRLRLLMLHGKNRFEGFKNRLSLAGSRLDTLSPLKILIRGYSVTRDNQQRVVRSIEGLKIGHTIETIVNDGRIFSVIEQKKPEVFHKRTEV